MILLILGRFLRFFSKGGPDTRLEKIIILKGQSNEFFNYQFLHYSNRSGPLTNGLKYFRFWFRSRRDIRIFPELRAVSYCAELDSLINITREMQRISELNTLVYQGNAGNLVKMNTLTNQRKDGNLKSRGSSKLACLDLALKILGRNDAAVQLRLKQIQLCKDAFFVHALTFFKFLQSTSSKVL